VPFLKVMFGRAAAWRSTCPAAVLWKAQPPSCPGLQGHLFPTDATRTRAALRQGTPQSPQAL